MHEAVVKVLAAEMCVTRCGLDLKDALINRQKRHIKGPSAQIEDQHLQLKGTPSRSGVMTLDDINLSNQQESAQDLWVLLRALYQHIVILTLDIKPV